MPSELESSVESFLVERVRQLGGRTSKFLPVEKGAPDRIVMLRGRIFLLEVKRDDTELSPAQRVWHRKARSVGVRVHTVFGRSGVISWLRWAIALDDLPGMWDDDDEAV